MSDKIQMHPAQIVQHEDSFASQRKRIEDKLFGKGLMQITDLCVKMKGAAAAVF